MSVILVAGACGVAAGTPLAILTTTATSTRHRAGPRSPHARPRDALRRRRGVTGTVEGSCVLVGNRAVLEDEGVVLPAAAARAAEDALAKGRIVVYAAVDGRTVGALVLADEVRAEARESIQRLQADGLRVLMLTGDRDTPAREVARQLGISDVRAELLPEDKIRIVQELKREGRRVCFVGDGINDAPALAEADVGVALQSGTEAAAEIADALLMTNVLASTPVTLSPVYAGQVVPQILNVQAGTQTFPDPLGGSTAVGGIYGVHYLSGGPPGATLAAVTPGNMQLLPAGSTETYTFAFRSAPIRTGDVEVKATLDGMPWTGGLGFVLSGPQAVTGVAVPHPATGVPLGAYTAAFTSGGPPNATLATISPSATQTVAIGSVATYTFEFRTVKADPGHVVVKATLDGMPWTGPVAYTVSGPLAISGTSVPHTSANATPGNYTVTYGSGGPPGASFVSLAPSVSQTLVSGATRTFTLEFKTDKREVERGTIVVDATLAGASGPVAWSGPVNFTINGPHAVGGSSAPTSATVPVGTYTLVYDSGGPPGATFMGVTPSVTQTLSASGTITYTLRFT